MAPNPEQWLDFGLALRTFLRETPGGTAVADAAFRIFTHPWEDLDALRVEGDGPDRLICFALLGTKVPAWANSLIRSHLTRDAGMQALQILCRQVMSRTDVSDAELKDAVRSPAKENSAAQVAKRLAQWDADFAAAALRARGYIHGR